MVFIEKSFKNFIVFGSYTYLLLFLLDFEGDKPPKPLSFISNVNANSNHPFKFTSLFQPLFTITLFCIHHSVFLREKICKYIRDNLELDDKFQSEIYCLIAAPLLIISVSSWNSPKNIIGGGNVWNIEFISSNNNFLFRNILTVLCVSYEIFVFVEIKKLKIIYSNKVERSSIYGIIRHPAMLGLLMILWITPKMSVSRFLFCAILTIYIFIGIYLEEKTLVKKFGKQYQDYQRDVPALVPALIPAL
eukprot:214346_1